ncbi:hypothetical protein [Nocardia sp. NPDC051463]|uniref:hypothetical protein n=1 Tax=Nocardia sp. NPDC051463 TaxID=3154845 RepID=UPI0034312C75
MTTDLNMDEPHEVNAVADKHTGAMTTITGGTKAVVRELVPTHRPQSELDLAMEGARTWATNTIVDALPRADRQAQAISDHTRQTTGVLAAADTTAGDQVRRIPI